MTGEISKIIHELTGDTETLCNIKNRLGVDGQNRPEINIQEDDDLRLTETQSRQKTKSRNFGTTNSVNSK